MHKCKSPSDPSAPSSLARRQAGFSLIEVSMSLAIIAIAFVALIGLLPAGMKVFEAATNTTAETRIISHLSGLVQASDYKNFKNGSLGGTLYYYDVDGGFLDSDRDVVDGYADKRIYAAKVLIDNQNIPNTPDSFSAENTGTRVLIAMGRNDPVVTKSLNLYTKPIDTTAAPINRRVKTQAIYVAKMDQE